MTLRLWIIWFRKIYLFQYFLFLSFCFVSHDYYVLYNVVFMSSLINLKNAAIKICSWHVHLFACQFHHDSGGVQRSARLSMKSGSRQLLFSLGWSRSRQPQKFPVSMSLGLDNHRISQSRWVSVSTPQNFPVSMSLGLDNHRISQSRWVSVSTTTEIPSLDESRSQQPQNLIVSMSLGLNINWISKYRL